jgi:hypothetical protein
MLERSTQTSSGSDNIQLLNVAAIPSLHLNTIILISDEINAFYVVIQVSYSMASYRMISDTHGIKSTFVHMNIQEQNTRQMRRM